MQVLVAKQQPKVIANKSVNRGYVGTPAKLPTWKEFPCTC
ncbi:hypothetical protein CP8484711_1586, partial [Chlamydia psittaci 84-8471/1]